jgi:hypothetical protein
MKTENYIISKWSYQQYLDDMITLKALQVYAVEKKCPIPFPKAPKFTGEYLEFDIPEEYQDYLDLQDWEKERADERGDAPEEPKTVSSLEVLSNFLESTGVNKFLEEQGRSITIDGTMIILEAKSAALEYDRLIKEYDSIRDPIEEFNRKLREDYHKLPVEEQKEFKLKLIAEGRIEA